MLRTMELILGLEPMTQYDASATPFYNAFTPTPSLSPYTALPPRVPIDEKTGKHPVTPGSVLPPRELLGDMLMELGRPAEALAAFEQAVAAGGGHGEGLGGGVEGIAVGEERCGIEPPAGDPTLPGDQRFEHLVPHRGGQQHEFRLGNSDLEDVQRGLIDFQFLPAHALQILLKLFPRLGNGPHAHAVHPVPLRTEDNVDNTRCL